MTLIRCSISHFGRRVNRNPRIAYKALDAAGQAYKYLEYGHYFGDWRRRFALS
jgi:hypothetical protein